MRTDYDVAILGCGPVGATLGCLLGARGLRTVILERGLVPYTLPRAIHIDHEIVRIFQAAGIEDDVLPCLSLPAATAQIGADGRLNREVRPTSMAPHFGRASDYFFYQPELERRLRGALKRFPAVDLRLDAEVLDLADTGETVSIRFGSSNGEERVVARFAVACDGASSTVRKALGISLDDFGFEEPWLVIDAEVDGEVNLPIIPDFPKEIDLQRTLIMICDPRRPMTIIPCKDRLRRWEFMLLPGETEADFATEDQIGTILAPWVDLAQTRVIRSTIYRFHGLVAHEWRRGRVFLAGDAAHQTPPFNGQGLCHGIRDAANLAWKLDYVLRGLCKNALLDSYQLERDGQVRKLIAAAIAAGRSICTLDPEAARARDKRMRQALGQNAVQYVDIIPPLAGGVLTQQASLSGTGERFIQPHVGHLGGEVLLDELAGRDWLLLAAEAEALATARESLPPIWSAIGKSLVLGEPSGGEEGAIHDVTGELRSWFERRACRLVLVRPDRYVFAAFNPEDSEGVAEDLKRHLEIARIGNLTL